MLGYRFYIRQIAGYNIFLLYLQNEYLPNTEWLWIGFGLVLDWFWIGFGLVLDWFWIGFGSVAIPIYKSLNIHLFALYMPYTYKDIWHIFWE